jgi:hypothetical protein
VGGEFPDKAKIFMAMVGVYALLRKFRHTVLQVDHQYNACTMEFHRHGGRRPVIHDFPAAILQKP